MLKPQPSIDIVEKNSFLRFYKGGTNFFENFTIWIVDSDINNRKKIFHFPPESTTLCGTVNCIFPSAKNLPDLDDQIFHMASITPDDGIRIVYSLIFKTSGQILFGKDKDTVIPKGTILIIAIESKYLHPSTFKSILMHTLNHLPYADILIDELESYLKPTISVYPDKIEFIGLPFDISSSAELGRFHHFIFSSFKINQVLNILLLLLCDASFLVTSVSTTQLSIGCFSLLSLLYPIQWPNFVISVLPEHLIEISSSPVPYIIGVPINLIGQTYEHGCEAEVFLNLDFAHVLCKKNLKISSKYSVLIKTIESLIEDELETYKTNSIFSAYKIQIYLWKFITGVVMIAAGITQEDLDNENLKDLIAHKIIDPTKSSLPENSLQTRLLESSVITHFCNNIIHNAKQNIPPEFFDVAKDMKSIMKYVFKIKR